MCVSDEELSELTVPMRMNVQDFFKDLSIWVSQEARGVTLKQLAQNLKLKQINVIKESLLLKFTSAPFLL